ncbi:MAG: hypothetical protein H5U29_10200 [Pusillimonas sp.]|nr:hypothetical protein [Pusillimonas sp.]
MTDIITSILPYAAGLVGMIGLVFYGMVTGKRRAESKQREKEREAIDKAHEVRNETNQIPDADLDDSLDKWVRNKR